MNNNQITSSGRKISFRSIQLGRCISVVESSHGTKARNKFHIRKTKVILPVYNTRTSKSSTLKMFPESKSWFISEERSSHLAGKLTDDFVLI